MALLSDDDEGHDRALRWSRENSRPVLLTEFILIEVANAFSRGLGRDRFVGLVRSLQANPRATVLPATHELFEQGFRLFTERPDKSWSLTDCISFVVMRGHGLTDALTADQHFDQAGFTILLR